MVNFLFFKSTQNFLQDGGNFVFVAICGGSSHILTGVQRDNYHVPGFKSRIGKINLRYNGVIVWNTKLSSRDPDDACQAFFFFTKKMKCAIIEGTV